MRCVPETSREEQTAARYEHYEKTEAETEEHLKTLYEAPCINYFHQILQIHEFRVHLLTGRNL